MKKIKLLTVLFALAFFAIVLSSCEEKQPVITGERTKYTDETRLEATYDATSDFIKDGIGQVTVVRYVDGDTTWFRSVGGEEFSLRYLGIDTPESTASIEPWGRAAAKFTYEKLSKATKIVVEAGNEIMDANGRYLGWVWYYTADNQSRLLNLELVEEGYAIAKGVIGTAYEDPMYEGGNRAQLYKDRVNGSALDPDYDYSDGSYISLKDFNQKYVNDDAIANQLDVAKKVEVQGIVTRKIGRSSAYIEQYDEATNQTYGLYIYGGYNDVTRLIIGNEVVINGNVGYYNDTVQLTNIDNANIKTMSYFNEVNPAKLSSDDFIGNEVDYIFNIVNLTDLQVVGGYDSDNNDSYTIKVQATLEDGKKGDLSIRVDSNVALLIDGSKNKTWKTFENAQFTSVTGIVTRYNGTYQIMLTSLADLTYSM